MTAPYDEPEPNAVAILNAALLHVPFDGWNDSVLVTGAADAGVEQHLTNREVGPSVRCEFRH